MKVFNVRLGFATNSSSVHSIVVVPSTVVLRHDEGYGDFGWDNFTLTEPNSKREYIAGMLWYPLMCSMDKASVFKTLHDLIGWSPHRDEYAVDTEYVDADTDDSRMPTIPDHQSRFSFPTNFDGTVNEEFIKAFVEEFVMRKDVVILGGSDNSNGHPMYNACIPFDTKFGGDYSSMPIARKDGKYWTLFNRKSGAKMRLSFDDKAGETERASVPELVDLKITDYCPYGCSFCHQGSTEAGKHAPLRRINAILKALAKHEVFEIAIGGGEPTLHPDFLKILTTAKSLGIVPNFTTRNLQFLRQYASEINKNCGGFAYSVHKASDVDALHKTLGEETFATNNRHSWDTINKAAVYLHVIPEVVGEKAFSEILQRAEKHGYNVTLLGFKSQFRGTKYARKPEFSWVESVARLVSSGQCPVVGIDTQIANDDEDEYVDRSKLNVPGVLVTKTEGAFSMYIDAVEQTCGVSSFCDKSKMVKFKQTTLAEELPAIFQNFDLE